MFPMSFIWLGVHRVVLLWGVVSVMFSPFAAGICMWLAHRRGLSVRQYGLIGAIFSTFFLFPWVYLVTRLLEREMPLTIAIAGYVVLYLGWFGSIYTEVVFYGGYGGTDFLEPHLVAVWIPASMAVITAVVSAWTLIGYRDPWQELPGDYTLNSRELVCIAPFALAFITIIVMLSIRFIT